LFKGIIDLLLIILVMIIGVLKETLIHIQEQWEHEIQILLVLVGQGILMGIKIEKFFGPALLMGAIEPRRFAK